MSLDYYPYIKLILDIIFKEKPFQFNPEIITIINRIKKEKSSLNDELTKILSIDENNKDMINKIIDKVIFHGGSSNNQIYIKEQESGSCGWFSLYWPTLFYLIIYENYDKYLEFIIKLLKDCKDLIKKIYEK